MLRVSRVPGVNLGSTNIRGAKFWCPYNNDDRILGSIVEFSYLGKVPFKAYALHVKCTLKVHYWWGPTVLPCLLLGAKKTT